MPSHPVARRRCAIVAAGLLTGTLLVGVGQSGAAAPVRNSLGAQHAPSTGPARAAQPLLPNMTPLRAADVYVTGSGVSRRLRFETSLANVGRGPMEVRPNRRLPCPAGQRGASQIIYRDVDDSGFFKRNVDTTSRRRKAGCMVFHATHNHWHFEASSFYALRPADRTGSPASTYRKTSFCLRDSERVPERMGTYHHPAFYGACSRDRPMGVNIGWTDVYQSFLDGQSLHLGRRRNVPNGRYCLSIRVDPKDALKESDERDNTSLRAIRIRGDEVTPLPNSVCA